MPAVPDDGVLVRVRALSLNRYDWYVMTGRPYLMRPQAGVRRPKDTALTTDFAGTVELVRSLGADHVVDYTRDDFTRPGATYDLILDVAGGRSWSELRRVLAGKGTLVLVGAPKGNRLLGPLTHILKVRLAAVRSS